MARAFFRVTRIELGGKRKGIPSSNLYIISLLLSVAIIEDSNKGKRGK